MGWFGKKKQWDTQKSDANKSRLRELPSGVAVALSVISGESPMESSDRPAICFIFDMSVLYFTL